MAALTPNERGLGKALVAAAATLWGTWPLILRNTGLSGPESCLVVLLAMSLPAPFLLRGQWRDRGATLALLLVAVGDAGSIGFYFVAMGRGPVAVALVTHYLTPVLVALAAPYVIGEARSRAALLATPLSLGGLAMLVWRDGVDLPLATAVLGATSAVFYMVVVFSAKIAARAYAPMAITSLHTPISALILLLVFRDAAIPDALHAGVWRVAAGGLVCGLGGSLLFYAGLKRLEAQVAGALTYLEPLVGAVLAVVVLGESMTVLGVVGALVVLGCGVWVALAGHAQPVMPAMTVTSVTSVTSDASDASDTTPLTYTDRRSPI